jgi:hypothetical protein
MAQPRCFTDTPLDRSLESARLKNFNLDVVATSSVCHAQGGGMIKHHDWCPDIHVCKYCGMRDPTHPTHPPPASRPNYPPGFHPNYNVMGGRRSKTRRNMVRRTIKRRNRSHYAKKRLQ